MEIGTMITPELLIIKKNQLTCEMYNEMNCWERMYIGRPSFDTDKFFFHTDHMVAGYPFQWAYGDGSWQYTYEEIIYFSDIYLSYKKWKLEQ